VALSQIWEANGNAATAGTSVTPTSTAISAVGDLLIFSLVVKVTTWSSLSITPNAGAINTPIFLGRTDHTVGDLSVALYGAVVTSQIASGSNFTMDWGVSSTGRYGTVTCFRADETFDAFEALAGVEDSVSAELASGTAFSSLATLDPASGTGLGFRLVGKLVNNSTFTQGTPWTSIRNAGNTTPMSIHTSRSFRTDATAYSPDCSGFSTTGRKALIAVHLPTGSAPAGGPVPRMALMGVG
jgi:hypothetical protein